MRFSTGWEGSVYITGPRDAVAATGDSAGVSVAGGGAPHAQMVEERRKRKDRIRFIACCASTLFLAGARRSAGMIFYSTIFQGQDLMHILIDQWIV